MIRASHKYARDNPYSNPVTNAKKSQFTFMKSPIKINNRKKFHQHCRNFFFFSNKKKWRKNETKNMTEKYKLSFLTCFTRPKGMQLFVKLNWCWINTVASWGALKMKEQLNIKKEKNIFLLFVNLKLSDVEGRGWFNRETVIG